MRILGDGMYEIRLDGKNIVLTYITEEKALNARMDLHKRNAKFIEENFPDGIFKDVKQK